jgi:hypothetical protein
MLTLTFNPSYICMHTSHTTTTRQAQRQQAQAQQVEDMVEVEAPPVEPAMPMHPYTLDVHSAHCWHLTLFCAALMQLQFVATVDAGSATTVQYMAPGLHSMLMLPGHVVITSTAPVYVIDYSWWHQQAQQLLDNGLLYLNMPLWQLQPLGQLYNYLLAYGMHQAQALLQDGLACVASQVVLLLPAPIRERPTAPLLLLTPHLYYVNWQEFYWYLPYSALPGDVVDDVIGDVATDVAANGPLVPAGPLLLLCSVAAAQRGAVIAATAAAAVSAASASALASVVHQHIAECSDPTEPAPQALAVATAAATAPAALTAETAGTAVEPASVAAEMTEPEPIIAVAAADTTVAATAAASPVTASGVGTMVTAAVQQSSSAVMLPAVSVSTVNAIVTASTAAAVDSAAVAVEPPAAPVQQVDAGTIMLLSSALDSVRAESESIASSAVPPSEAERVQDSADSAAVVSAASTADAATASTAAAERAANDTTNTSSSRGSVHSVPQAVAESGASTLPLVSQEEVSEVGNSSAHSTSGSVSDVADGVVDDVVKDVAGAGGEPVTDEQLIHRINGPEFARRFNERQLQVDAAVGVQQLSRTMTMQRLNHGHILHKKGDMVSSKFLLYIYNQLKRAVKGFKDCDSDDHVLTQWAKNLQEHADDAVQRLAEVSYS